MAVLQSFNLPRVERRTMIALGLAALSAFMVLTLTRPDASISILAAAEDLAVGAPLDTAAVTTRQVNDASGLVAGTELGELEGWTLAAGISAGEPLLSSLLVAPGRAVAPSSLSITLPETDAALGTIAAGDAVDIYVTWPATTSEPRRTELLAAGVEVLETRATADTPAARQALQILFAVDETLAPLIAGGHRVGELDLVRVGR